MMNREELDRILEDHAAWLKDHNSGKRADLTAFDLRRVDLSYVDLSYAIMTDVDLSYAIMTGADLSHAIMTGARLNSALLSGAKMQGAVLLYASLGRTDLTGANIDYSCWPLWCGSLDAVVDKRIFCQLAYHMCRVKVDDEECLAAQRALAGMANQFHRVDECGRIEFDKGTDEGEEETK